MKLGTLKSSESLDGILCVVSKNLKRAVKATHVAPSLREAMEKWSEAEPKLKELAKALENGSCLEAFDVKEEEFHSVMPRTWLFADGSAFIYHVKLVRLARNAPLPETLTTVPLMYQGDCGGFLAPTEDIPQRDFSHGTDFEGEVAVITDFVPMGVTPEKALEHVKLYLIMNDVSLRGLIPAELAQGFGFFQSKPASALSPFAVTADELGSALKDGRIHLPLHVKYNGEFFGKANGDEMFFHFGQLIAHAAKTRNLPAGTIIGSGTVSNEKEGAGSSCLAEKRMIEQVKTGTMTTPFMKVGDTVEMEMFDSNNQSIFGRIKQKVKAAP